MIKVISFLLISTYVLSAYAQKYNLITPDEILNHSEIDKDDGLIVENVDGCEVHMTRLPNASDMQLFWSRESVSIFMYLYGKISVVQDWNFGDVYINVTRDDDGKVNSTWKFSPTLVANVIIDASASQPGNGDSTPQAKPTMTWKSAENDESKITEYFGYMKEWCQNNNVFISDEDCAIAYIDRI